jgi:transposase
VIEAKVVQGLTAQRIYQDLVTEHGFDAKYPSVRRFVGKLRAGRPLPFRRMECEPGAEAQVDFGSGAPIITPEGKRRRTHVFRIVLSHSRKGYSESIFRQTTDGLIQCLENAFWAFGGAPRTIVIDNLKAAVSQADWYDPELNPKLQAFCEHYGTVLLPTKPYTPRHKGKTESGIKYVRSNALKGRRFASLAEQNRHLQQWEQRVADTRIHGTTKRQVGVVFAQVERAALLALPAMRFPCFQEAPRLVHRDGHVEVAKA